MERFYEFWSEGDPYTQSRFLVRTITPMVTIIPSYVLFVSVVGPAIMKHFKPIQMRPLMVIYNLGLVVFYIYFLAKGFHFIKELKLSFICGSLNSYDSPLIPDIFELAYQLYVVRYIELMDTIFLVLSKKFNMITKLHVFHHAIVPIFGWFGFRSETSGVLAVFMGINNVVHVVMYTYYALSALGPAYQKYLWWKKYITTLQIAQFFIMTIYLVVMNAIGCNTSKSTFYFSTILSVLFFFMFISYYKEAYNDTANEYKGEHRNSVTTGVPYAYRNAIKKKE